MTEPGLYNSLFYVLGKCYDWNLYEVANLYGTSLYVVELWLEDLGFPTDVIYHLEHRGPYPEGYCQYCGILSKQEYCCSDCKESHEKQKVSVQNIVKSGRIPIIGWRNIYWDINKGKIIRENCLR